MQLQWGYSGTYTGLVQSDWSPLFSDHSSSDVYGTDTVTQSPCYHDGPTHGVAQDSYRLNDGQLAISGANVPSSEGNVARVSNKYSYRAWMNQGWNHWIAEQAFYLSRYTARQNNLRVTLIGWIGGWKETVMPNNDFTIIQAQNGGCGTNGCAYHTDWLKRVVLTWNIGGRDVQVSISRPNGDRFKAQLNMTKVVGIPGCSDSTNDRCGNIDYHTYIADSRNGTIKSTASPGRRAFGSRPISRAA